MTVYPEVQRKAQEEIDRVIGNDRFPTLADQGSLPYVEAVAKELVRWSPVAPLCEPPPSLSKLFQETLTTEDPSAIPHVATEDGFYGDYFIPKGSSIITNVW